jgi:hypothetical protein
MRRVWCGGAYGAMIVVVLLVVAILALGGEVEGSLLESWWMRGIAILCTFWMLVATWGGRTARS